MQIIMDNDVTLCFVDNQIVDANESVCTDYGTPIKNSIRNDYVNCKYLYVLLYS